MQIQDMVKLIYQNEFAGGHFVSDEAESLKRLQDEYGTTGSLSERGQLFIDIGNGLCRIDLPELSRSADENRAALTTVNRIFVDTANSNKGEIAGFEDKIAVFAKCCEDGFLPFDIDEVKKYISGYKKQGYPPVSHSDIYRESYHPAYRVVSGNFRDFYPLFCRIDHLMETTEGNICIAIDGNSGSGKSALASLISRIYDCNIFHMDDFFLRPEQKTPERLQETGGNVDYERFKAEIAGKLAGSREFEYRKFDCGSLALTDPVRVIPRKLNIVEGSYSMHPSLTGFYDLKVFLHIGEDEQKRRIMERNGMPLYSRFVNEWIPMENRYFKEFDIRAGSDLIFP
ncbi:MAG: uridine kinase family protein [Saccharofermentanales bacterium]